MFGKADMSTKRTSGSTVSGRWQRASDVDRPYTVSSSPSEETVVFPKTLPLCNCVHGHHMMHAYVLSLLSR